VPVRALTLGLLLSALAALGPAGLAGATVSTELGAASAAKTKPVTISVVSVVKSSRARNKSPKVVTAGDNVTFVDVLFNTAPKFGKGANEQVGSDSGVLTFTSPHSARMQGVATLPDGTISFNGRVTVLPNKELIVPIVGGTGTYANATGTLLVGTGSKRALNTYALFLPASVGPIA
jgi:hypothetical protein